MGRKRILSIDVSGGFSDTERRLAKLKNKNWIKTIEQFGSRGVDALREATPKKTGRTSESWYYEIRETHNGVILEWKNSNVVNGENIALLIQRGHGKKNGGYVPARDYINPALRPIFEEIRAVMTAEVVKR